MSSLWSHELRQGQSPGPLLLLEPISQLPGSSSFQMSSEHKGIYRTVVSDERGEDDSILDLTGEGGCGQEE